MINTLKRTTAGAPLVHSDSKRDVWISLVCPTTAELHALADSFYLPFEDIQHILDKDEKAHLEVGEKYVLVVFQIPHNGKSHPFSILITRGAIITVALEEYEFIHYFLERPPTDFFTDKRTRAALYFYRAALRAFMRGLETVEKKMELVEGEIVRGRRQDTSLHEILHLQKQLIYFNTAIVSNEGVLEKILQDSSVPKFQSDQDILNDLLLENNQAKEMIKIYTQILSTIGDTYSSMISNNVNHTMKVLTSFTIIMTIPTIISSIYGMNIGLPLQDNPAAFLHVLSAIVVISALSFLAFRWQRWL